MRTARLLFLPLATALPAFAQVDIGVVQVDASPLGADYVTADVFIDVAEESDWWTVGGIVGGPVAAGLEHYLYFDPKTTEYLITAPGNSTAAQFATFVSLPRDQFSPKRFGPNGSATISGAYDPPGASVVFGGQEINIAFLEFPPSTDGVGVPDFGFIARVTLMNDPDDSGVPTENIVVSATPTGGRLLAEYHVASATREHPAPLSEFSFGFYAVPEPGTFVLLAAGAAALGRRRSR